MDKSLENRIVSGARWAQFPRGLVATPVMGRYNDLMEESSMQSVGEILDELDDEREEELGEDPTAVPAKKSRKVRKSKEAQKLDPVGISFYGAENFKGFDRVSEVVGLIPLWKEFYYEQRIKFPNKGVRDMLQEFNQKHAYPEGLTFHPYPTQVKVWRTKWDRDILEKKMEQSVELVPSTTREIRQIIKTKDGDKLVVPDDTSLEQGVRTLGGELINDALQMLRDDQHLEELYSDEVLLKRRNYIINVFAHTTRQVHGKAALMLKASQEKRENAGFLMELLAKATAGKMTDEEMSVLNGAYAQKSPVQAQPVTEPAHVQSVV